MNTEKNGSDRVLNEEVLITNYPPPVQTRTLDPEPEHSKNGRATTIQPQEEESKAAQQTALFDLNT